MKTLIILTVAAAAAMAQAPDIKTISGSAKALQNSVKNNVLKSAEKVSEEDYAFKPTPDVRSFGQLIGHIADANNNFCAASMGEKNPNPGIEKGKTSKADLVAALKDAIAYCDKAYDALTDANAGEVVKFGPGERARLGVLQFNSYHTNEHYGNLVTYMRLKGVVPPSSERR